MRKVHIANGMFYLNNEPYFQRLVMHQGYYPEGIWTAPSDEALKNDISLSKAAGFNGARLHQKVFEERFHYWADKLGFITWEEFPSWGMSSYAELASRNFLSEWMEVRYLEYQQLCSRCSNFYFIFNAGQKSDELCQPTFLHQRIRRSSMGDIHT